MKRRYADGGDTSQAYDADTLAGGRTDDSDVPAAEPRKTGFKDAFAAARRAGDKTFEWNGKKYTTDVATPARGTATSPERKDALRSRAAPMETPYDRMNRMNRNEASARSVKLNAERQTLKDNLRKDIEAKASKNFKAGGSVGSASKRADGCITKGRTRGRMV